MLNASLVPLPGMEAAGMAGATPALRAGYGVSLGDMGAFAQAMSRAQGAAAGTPVTVQPAAHTQAPGRGMQALFKPLEAINAQATGLQQAANTAVAGGQPMSPGQMVQLTVRCHEFMFHCQLMSNAANRTSDGLQQLFRQQA